MLETIFRGVFDTQLTSTIAPEQFLLCVGASLVIGLVLCALMLWRTRPSAGFPSHWPPCPRWFAWSL